MNNYMKIIINALKQWVNENLAAFDAKILNKVDKVNGKGLSTNDFTNEDKNKLNSITIPLSDNFIPDNIARKADVSKEITEAIEKIPEVKVPVTSVNGQTGDVVIEIPEQKDITVNGVSPDESGNIQIEIGSGGVSSWNDLTDKPFYEETSPVTITWDGNIDGRENVYVSGLLSGSGTYVHVSNIVPKLSEIYGAAVAAVIDVSENVSSSSTIVEEEDKCVVYEHNDTIYEIAIEMDPVQIGDSSLGGVAHLAVARIDNANVGSVVLPKAGVYFLKTENEYVTSLSLLEYTSIQKIDEKFIPDSIARMDDLTWGNLGGKPFGEEDVVIEWDGNTDGRESATGTYTWYHMSDNVPTVDELTGGIYEAYLHSNSSTTSSGITNRALRISGDCIIVGDLIIIAKVDNAATQDDYLFLPEALPKAGVYFVNIPGNAYISKLSYNTTKTLDEKFISDTIARKSDIITGGVSSWNDLTDRPFYEENNQTVIEWDGNIDGRDVIPYDGSTFCYVSDVTPSATDCIGGTLVLNINGEIEEETITEDFIEEVGNCANLGLMLIAYKDNAEFDGLIFPKAGLYFYKYEEENYFTQSLTYGSSTIVPIDEKYIPASIARVSDIPILPEIPEINYPVTSVNGQTGDVVIEIHSTEGLATEEYVNNAITNINTYYTKAEIDNMEFITLDEIDAICARTIEIVTPTTGTF